MWSAVLVLLGTLLFGVGNSFPLLVVARYLIGLGSGMSTVNVPLYLAEVSPAERRGSVGVLNQVSICTGILLALLASLFLVGPGSSSNSWRLVPLVSSAIAVVQVSSLEIATRVLSDRTLDRHDRFHARESSLKS